MTQEEKTKWIKTLKEGDIVYNIESRYSTLMGVSKYTIKKITNNGRIRLDNDTLLDDNGCKYVERSYSYNILPMCDKVQNAIDKLQSEKLRMSIINNIQKIPRDHLNYNILIQIGILINKMID